MSNLQTFKVVQVVTAVVFSVDGYDKETTIERAKSDLENRLRKSIPEGMQCSLVTGECEGIFQ